MTDSLQSWNSMHALSERILRTNSATDELERWCRDNAIGDGQIVALCDRDARPEALDDESLEALYPYQCRDKTTFRKVRLATAGIAVVDALNWFFPNNLSSDIREQLETSAIPFGRAIRHLNPKRRSFLVRRCTPAQLVDAAQSIDPTAVAFEHRAVVYRDDDVPLAVVHEHFRAILVYRFPELVPTSEKGDLLRSAATRKSIRSGGVSSFLVLARDHQDGRYR